MRYDASGKTCNMQSCKTCLLLFLSILSSMTWFWILRSYVNCTKETKSPQEPCKWHFFQLIIHEQNNIPGKNNTSQEKQQSYQSYQFINSYDNPGKVSKRIELHQQKSVDSWVAWDTYNTQRACPRLSLESSSVIVSFFARWFVQSLVRMNCSGLATDAQQHLSVCGEGIWSLSNPLVQAQTVYYYLPHIVTNFNINSNTDIK